VPTNHDPQSAPGLDSSDGRPPGAAPTTAPGRPGVAAPLADRTEVPEDAPVSKTGTTTVAIATDEAVVMAADRRASLGGRFVSNKNVEKVERVHPRAAITLSGSVGGVQAFARSLRAEASLYETRRGEPPSMEAVSTLAGNLIRGVPAQVQLGGVDEDGPVLYELDGGGSVLETDYAAGGSGMQLAYGHLEDAHGDVEGVAEARTVATRAVDSASERDTASGNGVTVATVTGSGVETDTVEEVGG
jgi:proteasome beta subunit